ncbi:3-oxo-5-alpha-steroid 4-dehydrogenase 1 isoform X3 [Parus major]|uniref:3-oxo-5-alpha-steroid 4-dehydrogenase 1 isoform X3 n=1 Tax=Parus major TaxID=9157 RepID=UPI000771217E|nr:3-oxo-5-alpha-steroid 4-dehydrogenase 1 isoform X3 [Parus major]
MGFAGDGGVCALWRRAAGPEERRLLELFSYGLMALGAASALLLCFIPMPYGRYSSRRFGCLVPARPAWALQELPSLLVPLGLAACGGAVAAARPNCVLLGCFLLHYAHRALIFPLLIREGKPTPFFTFVLALLFCAFNGYLQGRSLTTYAIYPAGWLGDSRFITGGMFEYVSGANFFGEILEWFGFALACYTIESLAFALCTLFILGSRARQHHKWYLEKFEDYPKDRKIVIPFLY